MTNQLFNSNRNYMKKDSTTGQTTMLGPNVSHFAGSWYTRQVSIAHNLGYVPLFRSFYEPYLDGKIYETMQDVGFAWNTTINLHSPYTATAPTCLVWADATNIYFELYFTDATLAANVYPIYYVIYRDYGLS